MSSTAEKEQGLWQEFTDLLRDWVVADIEGKWAGGGIPLFPTDPLEMGISGYIRADTLPGGMPTVDSDPREFRRRMLDRSEDLIEHLAAHHWHICHGTLKQGFKTHFGSPQCTLGNEVVKAAPQFSIELAVSVSFRKFTAPAGGELA